MVVEADAVVNHRWPELSAAIRRAFNERDDIDACASVALTARGGAIAVQVALPDGRTAARSVSRPEDVLPVVEALLLVPRRDEPSAVLEPQPSARPAEPAPAPMLEPPRPPRMTAGRPAFPAAARPPLPDSAALDVSPAPVPDPLRVELSVAAGARIGDGQTSTGLAAFSFLEIERWLAGFEGRIDHYENIGGGSDAAALELAAQGGRRWRFSTLALDFFAGPALVLQGTATNVTETAPNGRRITESSSSTVLRWLGGARLNLGTRSTVRSFVGVDGEFGPQRAPGAELPRDAPRLPRWTVGLALGATVGKP